MPQENKKRGRGRRGQEKEKRETVLDELRARADAADDAPPAKRPKLSPPAYEASYLPPQPHDLAIDDRGNDNVIQAIGDDHDYDHDHSQHHDSRPEAQFFGLLEESEQAYFKRADLLLENDSFGSADERALFLNSVWSEARGKELKIACSQSCSRVLERLVRGSTSRQLKATWGRLKGNFLALVQHRFASHCVEALFMAAAPLIADEMLNEGPVEVEQKENEFEDEDTQASQIPIERSYLDTITELKDHLGFLITDPFASHTIRVLLVVLSGKPLAGSKSLLQSKKKEKVHISGTLDSTMLQARVVPESLSTAASNLIRDAIVGLDTNYLRALATNPLANPVLQLFLELEFAGSGKQAAKDEKSLYRRLLPDEPPSEGTQTAAFVKGLLYDPVGSRLLETIIQNAPGKTFKTIYKVLFKDQLGNIVKNDVASFVIIKILERLSQEELQSAVEQIVPQISLLFDRQRSSVVKCLVERCRTRDVDTSPVASAIEEAFGRPGQSMVEKLLQPNTGTQDNMSAERKTQLDQNNQVKMHASLLAQSMLAHRDATQKLILDGLIACESDFLAILAKDRTATHVLQAALDPEASDKSARRQLVQKLQQHAVTLALDNIGSHVVDVLNRAARGLHFLRERIADDLAKHQDEIKDSYSGRQVWRNWMLDLYLRRRADWVAKMKELHEDSSGLTEKGRETMHNEHPDRVGGGIAAARARFAAQKKRQNAATAFGRKPNRPPAVMS